MSDTNEKDTPADTSAETSKHFIRQMIEDDLASGKHSTVVTRFPPEPNGYLHIGHAKAICLDFGMALEYGGRCHLRFDDTNPVKEDIEYVESIQNDIRWLGFDWGDHKFYCSDYFQQLYDYAAQLIEKDLAYVCDLDVEAFGECRGVPHKPGKDSPNRNRPVAESLDLFTRMKAGEFEDGAYVVRAKIDMASPNLHLRDPAIYRIKHATHHHTGDDWCIYPMYDFAHCLSDSIEGITHSLCTLEFEVHRPLYDWILDNLDVPKPQPRQTEFSRLNLSYTVMSKRKLLQLVTEGHVAGWDDPRMPTLAGLRRRGVPPEAIRNLCEQVGITKYKGLNDIGLLENEVRSALNPIAPRFMGVLDPLKVVITNYPDGDEETFEAVNNPENEADGTRAVPFSRELWIDRADFMEEPPRKFFRLGPGREVRLRAACYITCTDVVKDDDGNITELHCTYDPESRGGSTPDGRKVKGTIHWVSAKHAVIAEVRLYDRLFSVESPDADKEHHFLELINPDSLDVRSCPVEPAVAELAPGSHFQFERVGYFITDSKEHGPDKPVFNRTVPLRDSWAKKAKKK